MHKRNVPERPSLWRNVKTWFKYLALKGPKRYPIGYLVATSSLIVAGLTFVWLARHPIDKRH